MGSMHKRILKEMSMLLALAVLGISGMTAGPAGAQTGPEWSFEVLDLPTSADRAHFSLSRDGRSMGCVVNGSVYWWTEDDGYRFLAQGDPAMVGVGMSADGRALAAGRVVDSAAVPTVWFDDGRVLDLGLAIPDCPKDGLPHWSCDVGTAGSVVVGQTTDCRLDRGFVWTASGGLRLLEGGDECESHVNAVSADGNVVVGFCEHPGNESRRPVLWREGTGHQLFLGETRQGEARNVSPDGRFVVGQVDQVGLVPQAFSWSEDDGHVNLGTLRGRATDPSLATSVSNDGRVVGWSGDSLWGEQEAFIWTSQMGMMGLAQLLKDQGLDLPDNLIITTALDISGDGRTVVGVGRDKDWNPRFWRATLGETKPAPRTIGSSRPDPHTPDSTRPDSLDAFHSDMLHPFPFGKHRYAPFQ